MRTDACLRNECNPNPARPDSSKYASPMTPSNSHTCTLCGLPLRNGRFGATIEGRELSFCCGGCRMVYAMLLEATDSPDPSRFRESELYRRCVAAGVVPATEADLIESGWRSEDPEAAPDESRTDDRSLILNYRVTGMWCPACAWVIETALNRQPGVDGAACDFATDRLRCRYDPTRTDPAGVETIIRSLGYTPEARQGASRGRRLRGEFVRLVVCALLAMNVMMLSWALYSGFFTSLSGEDIRYLSWPVLVMATIVLAYGGAPLFRKAWWGVRTGAPGMETLVCLGAGSAYLYSLHNFAAGSWQLYFDTATMLITLVLLGKMLESRAKARVRSDLEGFLALQPNKARICSERFPQGRFADIDQLVPNDIFRVLAGEVVPADGRVLKGRGWVDEAAVTGESRPRAISPGDNITSGTLLAEGDVAVTARRVGPEAMLGQMIAVIESGLLRRTPLESRTDRWLALFVPVMAGLAAATTVVVHGLGSTWEQAFVRGLTVLVIACPCALGIAVPLARIAGMSAAGRKGILVRDFEAFERSRRIDTVVFDKTGTLTRGRWSLERIEPCGGMSSDEAAALAAGLEKNADHAIARAVKDYVQAALIEPAPVQQIKVEDTGIRGLFQGREARIGTSVFAFGRIETAAAGEAAREPLSRVHLSVGGQACAVFWFGDRIRTGAAALVERLCKSGRSVHLISGDAHGTTAAVARGVGIGEVRGGLLPKDKADYIGELQRQGRTVVMVGDGINDAPALALADLSVAVHGDAALTRQAANLTLMRGDPAQLLDFLALAGRVNAKVAQNLACAWVYNLIGIPIAMSGWLNPLVAATAMLLSSLTVIGNTLRLARK